MKIKVNNKGELQFLDLEAIGILCGMDDRQTELLKCAFDAISDFYERDINELHMDRVIFSDPATVVFWRDGEKTVVKCTEGDTFNREMGIAMCTLKKIFGRTYKDYKKHVAQAIEKATKDELHKKLVGYVKELKDAIDEYHEEKGTKDDILSAK